MNNEEMNIDPARAREILREREQQDDVFQKALREMEQSEQPVSQATVTPKPPIPVMPTHFDDTTTSLGRVELGRKRENSDNQVGYFTIPTENLPTSGMFYSDGTVIQIRSASVKEIRHYSTLEEESPYDIQEKQKNILQNCCRIKIPGKPGSDYRDIVDIDRLYILFAIQELTFPNGENKLQITSKCTECSTSNTIDFKKNSIDYINFDERLKRIYSNEEKCFILRFKNTDEVIRLYMPTIGKSNILFSHIQNKYKNNVEFDVSFFSIANFLFSDWRLVNDASIREMDMKTYKWTDKSMFSSVVGIIDIIRKGISLNVKYNCSNCGSEVAALLEFQGGWKSLFLHSDPFANLL